MSASEDSHGFTLIELLVVVTIIGILAAIAIPSYLGQRESAYQASLKHDLRTAQIAADSVAISGNGSYLALDGSTHLSAGFVAAGYEGSDNTELAIAATATTYCIEAFDVRAPDKVMVVSSGVAGMILQPAGC